MPITRAARRAARCLTEVLPADALGLVLYQLPLAHDIAAVAPTCHALDNAAKIALKLRPFSGEFVTLRGHGGRVRAVTALPDGQIITGSYDSTVKVWRDGTCVRTIQAHAKDIECVAVLPDGARFVSGSDDRTVKLWTLDGALERTFFGVVEFGFVWAFAALPDGVHFAVALGDYALGVRLYHVDGTLVHTFEGHADIVHAVAATPDGQHIISGCFDRLVYVWSVANKSLVSTCEGHTEWVRAVAVMPDGQRILSGGDDSTVRVWLLDGTLENTFSELHVGTVTALVALPDNQHAISGSFDFTVKLFNVDDGAVLRTFWHHLDSVWSLALLPDGLRFVSASSDNTARIAYHGLAP
jgi:WD40 repeat protein